MYKESYRKASELADAIRDGTYQPRSQQKVEEVSTSFFEKRKQPEPEQGPYDELEGIAEMMLAIRMQNEELKAPTSSSPDQDVGSRLVTDLMADFGLSRGAAAGVVGSLAHESADFKIMQEIEPVVPGSRGGYGYAQWTGPRRKEFESWVEAEGLDINSYEANYGNLKRELLETAEGKVVDKLRGIEDASQAANVFTKTFLRPGVVAMDNRVSKAKTYVGEPND